MIFEEPKYHFLHAALQKAEKALDENEVPIGAVVVFENNIIGRGYNRVERLKDPTAHAEMISITIADKVISGHRSIVAGSAASLCEAVWYNCSHV